MPNIKYDMNEGNFNIHGGPGKVDSFKTKINVNEMVKLCDLLAKTSDLLEKKSLEVTSHENPKKSTPKLDLLSTEVHHQGGLQH